MKSMRFSLPLLAALALTFCLTVRAQAQTFTSLWSFDGTDGSTPQDDVLVQGMNGRLYGTTASGGTYRQGTIFEMTAEGTTTSFYSFCQQYTCPDGDTPYTGLVLGTNGNLYGTTAGGGANFFYGTVFEITPAGKLTTLYSFCTQPGCPDGFDPKAPLVLARNGNFYGITDGGGATGHGTIFQISRAGKFKTVYNFCPTKPLH